MKRAIIVPPMPSPEALAELKQWLALSGPRDDTMLERLLGSAFELCEGFTGQMPLEATCEEVLAASSLWQPLATRPVQAVLGVERVGADGTRSPLAADAFAVELDPDGGARVRVSGSAGDGSRCASSPASRPTGTSCPKACATALSGSPLTSTGRGRAPPAKRCRPRLSPLCGVRGAG